MSMVVENSNISVIFNDIVKKTEHKVKTAVIDLKLKTKKRLQE